MVLSIAGQYVRYELGHERALGFVHQFYLSEDNNVATYFGAFLQILASTFLFLIGRHKKQEQEHFARHWLMLSLVFVCLSVEEAVRFSFLLDATMAHVAAEIGVIGVPELIWLGIAFILAAWYVPFLRHLPRETRRVFVLGAVLFVPAGLLLEYVGRVYGLFHGYENFVFSLINTAEEAIEMSGILVFLHALLRYLSRHVGTVSLSFQEDAAAARPLPHADPVPADYS